MIYSVSKICRDAMSLNEFSFDGFDEKWKLNSITSDLICNALLFIFCIFETILLTIFVGYRMIGGAVISYSMISLFGTNSAV